MPTVTRSSRLGRKRRKLLVESLAGLAAQQRVRLEISRDYVTAA